MKLPIKFRGREIQSGNLVYGRSVMQYDEGDVWLGDGFYSRNNEIKPETLTQLVGYDKNGREVYEGDALETDEGTVYASVLRHAKIAPCNDMEFSEMAERFGWKLKEVAENENDG